MSKTKFQITRCRDYSVCIEADSIQEIYQAAKDIPHEDWEDEGMV